LNANTKFVVPNYPFVFVDVGGDIIMVDDATTSSNPLVVPI